MSSDLPNYCQGPCLHSGDIQYLWLSFGSNKTLTMQLHKPLNLASRYYRWDVQDPLITNAQPPQ